MNKEDYRNIIIKNIQLQNKDTISYGYTYLNENAIKQLQNFIITNYKKRSLYRYTSLEELEREKNCLLNDTLFLTSLNIQNDPFEFSFDSNSDIFDSWKEIGINKEITEIFRKVDQEFNKSEDYQKNEYAIKCFCESFNNLLLWSYYANGHAGICIEYDMYEMFNKFKHHLIPVVYQDELPKRTAMIPETNQNSLIRLTTKATCWKHEDEWRVAELIGDSQWYKNNKIGKSFDCPKAKAIYLGCKIKESDEREILNLCKEKNITLYKMSTSKHKYALEKNMIYKGEN